MRVLQMHVLTSGICARTLLIAAHPDDEVIGASTLIPRLSNLTIVHVTDGRPGKPEGCPGAWI